MSLFSKYMCLTFDLFLMHNLLFIFLPQSAKTNLNVEQVFFSIARDIKQRLSETDSKPEVQPIS